jgi:hypothetical protein
VEAIRSSRSGWFLAAGIAIVDLIVRLLVALRPLEYIDGMTVPDDAYISLTIARNIARGLGPYFGTAHTNGFQPLYVFLAAPFFRWFPGNPETPVHAALMLLCILDAIALLLLCRFLTRIGRSSLALLALGAVWVFNPYAVKTTVNGLETSMSIAALAATLLAFTYYRAAATAREDARRAILLGLCGGVAILARIDNAFLLLAIWLLILRRHSRPWAPRPIVRATLLIAAPAILVNLPWWIYSLHYTGDIFPISGRAVRYQSLALVDHAPTLGNWYLPLLGRSLKILLFGNRVAIAGGLILGLLLIVREGRAGLSAAASWLRELSPLALHALFLVLAYSLFVFTPWFFPRYLAPTMAFFALGFACVADGFRSRIANPQTRQTFSILLLVLAAGLNFGRSEFRQFYTSKDNVTQGYMNLGLWARQQFPDGTRIGSMQSGALAYFADNLTVINLDGVVNRPCYDMLVRKQGIEYIRGSGTQYVVDWLENIDHLRKESASWRDDDLIPLGRIDGFGTWRHNWFLFRVNDRR